MKHRILALVLAGMLTAAATACGSTNGKTSKNADAKPTVAYKDMQVGETATDLKADLKILTNRTDLVDSDFQDYISEFNAMYPNITVRDASGKPENVAGSCIPRNQRIRKGL